MGAIILEDISCLLFPGARIFRSCFQGDHYGIGRVRVGNGLSDREFIGPDVVEHFRFPEYKGGKYDVHPGGIVVPILCQSVAPG